MNQKLEKFENCAILSRSNCDKWPLEQTRKPRPRAFPTKTECPVTILALAT